MFLVGEWGAAFTGWRARQMIDMWLKAARAAWLRSGGAISKWLGLIMSAAVLGLTLYTARGMDWAGFELLLSAGGLFWICLIAAYFHAPVADQAMLGRLWDQPKGLFATLCRKQIVNAVALPYGGDGLLLAWAHKRGICGFGAIKDAAIMSGMAGSLVTFAIVLPVWQELAATLGITASSLFGSLGLLSTVPLFAVLNRTNVFSLAGRELCRMGVIHMARFVANIGLMALCWHLLEPAEPIQSWLVLAAARMVVSRLPLLPNKEIALAAVAGTMFPGSPEVSVAVMVTGLLLTLGHLVVWFAIVVRREHGAPLSMPSA